MEVLRQLTEKQILDIRERFLRSNDGLTPAEFESVMQDAYRTANIPFADFRLIELFNEVDVNGDGTMSWDEFTMFIINCNDPTVPKAAIGTSLDDGMVTRYIPGYFRQLDVPRSVVLMQPLPRLNLLLRMSRTERSGTRIKLSMNNDHLTDIAEIALPDGVHGLGVEYVPPVSGKVCSSTILVSCNDCTIRFYDANKSLLGGGSAVDRWDVAPSNLPSFFQSPDDQAGRLKVTKELRLLESQTVIRWSTQFERMILGSRTGVISVLDIDAANVFSHEKLHALLIADMLIADDLLFTASVDPVSAVKCVDLNRNVVKYAIKDHSQGATLLGHNSRTQQLFSVGFDTTILAHAVAMPKVKPFRLTDSTRPHRGRITSLQVVAGTPQVISADSEGLIKVWDIRMNHCVQNLTPRADDVDCEGFLHGITGMAYLESTKRLVACGRELITYNYDAATNPHLADDKPAHFMMYNAGTHTMLTIHDRTAKLWEASTGMLRSWFKDLFPEEVTAACFVAPHERSIITGTFSGELYVNAYVLGTFQRKLTPRCRMGPSEVVQVVYSPTFRDYGNGYVIAAYKKEVIAVADASDDRWPFHMRSLDAALEKTSVKSIALCRGGFLCVGTSDGQVRLVDLLTFNIMWTWGQGHLKGDILSVASMPLVSSLSGILFFFSDSCGAIVCAVSPRPNTVALVGSWQCKQRKKDSDATLCHSPSGADMSANATALGSISLPPLHPSTERRSVNSSVCGASPRRRMTSADVLFGDGRPNSAVAAYFQPSSREGARTGGSTGRPNTEIYAVAATHMELLPASRMVVVGDERGALTVWNIQEFLMAAMRYTDSQQQQMPAQAGPGPLDPLVAAAPAVHAHWRAHEDELTSLCSFTHSGCPNGLPVIGTSALDREVRLWSADGVCLGNISHERITGRALAPGMKPFLLENPPASAWDTLGAHLEATNEDFSGFVSMFNALSMSRRLVSSRNCASGGADKQLLMDESIPVVDVTDDAPADTGVTIVEPDGPTAKDAPPTATATGASGPVFECQTFLTAVTNTVTRAPESDELLSKTVQLASSQSEERPPPPRLDSRSLRKRASNKIRNNAATRLASEAYSSRDPQKISPRRSPKQLDDGTAGDMLLVASTSPKLVDLCFSQIRRGFDVKRPVIDILHELSPRGDNPTDLAIDARTPRKPGPPPLWKVGPRPREETQETKRLWKKLSHEAVCIGTEGERALNNSGRVVVPPSNSGASPSARSLRWRSLTS